MISLNQCLSLFIVTCSFFLLQGIAPYPSHPSPDTSAQIKSLSDNPIRLSGVECKVNIEDHRPESYTDSKIPKFTNYFTPKVSLNCSGSTYIRKAILFPIDWEHYIKQNSDSLPEAFKEYALEERPEIPFNAVPYTSKIYPGKSYLAQTEVRSLKEQAIDYIKRYKGQYFTIKQLEALETLPQELKEKINL